MIESIIVIVASATIGAFLISWCYQAKINKLREELKSAQNELCYGNHALELQVSRLNETAIQATMRADIWKEQAEEIQADNNVFRAELGLPPKKVEQRYRVTY